MDSLSPSRPSAPESITGGCLCGSVRYTVTFTDSFPWPPVSSTCQCTMCRKWTSSLVAQFLILAPSQLEPPLDASSTYKEYSSSSGRFRGFCGQCGTSLIWRSIEDTSTFDLFLGTLDEKWLVGEKEVGKVLAAPNGTQFWLENTIGGVTDILKGGKEYLKEGPDGLRDV